MDWLVTLRDGWRHTFSWVILLSVLFGVLSRFMPCNRGMFWWKDLRALGTDVLYWFLAPVFVRTGRALLVAAGLGVLAGGPVPHAQVIDRMPVWLQCLAVLVLQDVVLYWTHRLFHTRGWWKFHAVHHSPEVLDWMAAIRFHPVNSAVQQILPDLAVLALGFPISTLVLLVPFNIMYSTMVHANLNWTFGWFRYVFASPVFHRWHHTTRDEGLDRNFAATFPVLDLMFGTYYMPAGVTPAEFGNSEADFPTDFWGQLVFPFRAGPANRQTAPKPPGRFGPAARLAAVVGVVAVVYIACSFALDRLPPPAESARDGVQAGRVAQTGLAEESSAGAGERDSGRILLGHRGPVLCVAMTPDGKTLVSGGEDGDIRVWDPLTGAETGVIHAQRRAVRSLALSRDGARLVSGHDDRSVIVWDASSGTVLASCLGHAGPVLGVAVSGDGTRVVSGSADWTAKVWDATSSRNTISFRADAGAMTTVALSADGRLGGCASGCGARVWNAVTGQGERRLDGHTDLVYRMAITPDARRVATAGFDENVRVWDSGGKELLTLIGHIGPVYGVALTPDARMIVSGGADRTVRVWDGTSGGCLTVLSGHADAVTGVAVSGDGRRVASSGRDRTVRVWTLEPDEAPSRAAD